MNTDTRKQIETALRAFSAADLCAASIGLLNTLGYQSEKTLDLGESPEIFLEQFDNNPDQAFRKDKAIFSDWKEIHLLFQHTDVEFSSRLNLFSETGVKQGLMSSYLFFAIRLTGESYARGKLAQITRQLINEQTGHEPATCIRFKGKLEKLSEKGKLKTLKKGKGRRYVVP